jgi:hypothetical protein
MARKTEQLSAGRRRIAVSNLDKILYPGTKFTKAKVIDLVSANFAYLCDLCVKDNDAHDLTQRSQRYAKFAEKS